MIFKALRAFRLISPPALGEGLRRFSLNGTGTEHESLQKRLALLELKLQQAGLNTQFLHADYATQLTEKLANHKKETDQKE
ncbi:hypothetical protein H7F13_04145 [Proteus vulgaris]|nr:hypothetical protein H7F13_04145 [Proteus vulgaris]